MKKTLLSVLLVGALAACQNDPAPATPTAAPSAAPAPEAPVLTAEQQEQQKLEMMRTRVDKVMEILKVKHPQAAEHVVKVNIIPLNPNDTSESPEALFELVTPESVLYTTEDVSYFLVGNLFVGEGTSVTNVTQRPAVQQDLAAARSASPSQDQANYVSGPEVFSSLPLSSGFNYVYGTGENKIASFEDPDCRQCQRFHQILTENAANLNVTVTVFPFVLESLHPEALGRAKSIICSADPTSTWKKWMTEAATQPDLNAFWATWAPENAPTPDCPQAVLVDGWQQAGRSFGFSATPTLMFENGETAEGALDADQLMYMFQKVAQEKSQPSVPVAPEGIDAVVANPALAAPQM